MTETETAIKLSLRQRIQQAYLHHVLTHQAEPASVYSFMQALGEPEAAFYVEYGSFEAIGEEIWKQTLVTTLDRLEADPMYAGYSVREKLLSFYFVWVEELKNNRSFIVYSLNRTSMLGRIQGPANALRSRFRGYASSLVNEGIDKGEIQSRSVLTDGYADSLWLQLLFVLNFWVKDTSPNFERTDAAIEKAVNLSLQLLGRNTLDHAFDLAKFLLQRKS